MERIGDITIYNADCMEIMQTLPNESIDAIITDPPYGISFLSPRTDNHKKIANDGLEEFKYALPLWLKEFHRLLTPTGVACCCCCGSVGKLNWLHPVNTPAITARLKIFVFIVSPCEKFVLF